MRRGRVVAIFVAFALSACAWGTLQDSKKTKPDSPQARQESASTTLDLGKGDSIRLMGAGDGFECDDPAYSGIDKIETVTLLFADGTSKRLCKRKHPRASEELARQYVATRAQLLTFPEMGRATPGPADRRALGMIAAEFLKQHCRGANCSPDHPQWKRAAAVIEQDLDNILADIAADPKLQALANQVYETFVAGIAARLTSEELRELGSYYSRSPGLQFVQIQGRLVNAFTIGLVEIQERPSQRRRQVPEQRPDPAQVKELLSLFDETIRIQLAILDAGPGKDRSGLQAIPIMFMAVAQERFVELGAIWNELGAADRSAILAWRDSPLARKERNAIYESAKNIRTFFDPDSQTNRLARAASKYEHKWRSLIQASPK